MVWHRRHPWPPPENRLNLTINAGEKKYRGSLH